MANLATSADILDDILSRAGEPTDGTSDLDGNATIFLNRAYRALLNGGGEIDPEVNEIWWWLRKDSKGVLTLNPAISDGTVSVTNNSTSVTFSSAPTPSVQGRHIKIDDHADVFVISAHNAGEAGATLESVYTGDTDATASYKVFQTDYSLASDVLYLAAPMFAFQSSRGNIDLVDLAILRAKWPLNEIASGVPYEFAMVGEQKVRFSHFGGTSSTDLIKVDYEYMRLPSDLADDATEPAVPLQYRPILSDWALALLLENKEDTRAGSMINLAKRGLAAMVKANRLNQARASRHYGKIQPRQGDLQKFIGPLRTESGLIIG